MVHIRTNRPAEFVFIPGQFARISSEKRTSVNSNSEPIWRAQSITSGPHDKFLEFFIILGEDGQFSKELQKLKIGDNLFLDNQNYGYLTLDRFPSAGDLWLFASGSGIAPFVSILKHFQALKNFKTVNLVLSLRDALSLTYYNDFLDLNDIAKHPEIKKKFTFIPIITQEITTVKGLVRGKNISYNSSKKRFTSMLTDGRLEELIHCKLSLKESKIMLCGNPLMIKDTRNILKNLGFKSSRKNIPGEIAVENYW